MRKLWAAMKLFQVPINHPYIQNLTPFDLNFIEYSGLWDNPKLREKLQNTFYDEEFEDWADETEELTPEEEALFHEQNSKKTTHMEEISEEGVISSNYSATEDYASLEASETTPEDISDEWEEAD